MIRMEGCEARHTLVGWVDARRDARVATPPGTITEATAIPCQGTARHAKQPLALDEVLAALAYLPTCHGWREQQEAKGSCKPIRIERTGTPRKPWPKRSSRPRTPNASPRSGVSRMCRGPHTGGVPPQHGGGRPCGHYGPYAAIASSLLDEGPHEPRDHAPTARVRAVYPPACPQAGGPPMALTGQASARDGQSDDDFGQSDDDFLSENALSMSLTL